MESVKKLVRFLNSESQNNNSIKPSWDGHKWITLIDLPSLGKFGLGTSEDKMKSVEMALDHAALFIDDYFEKHPELNVHDDIDDLNYSMVESSDGSIVLSVCSKE